MREERGGEKGGRGEMGRRGRGRREREEGEKRGRRGGEEGEEGEEGERGRGRVVVCGDACVCVGGRGRGERVREEEGGGGGSGVVWWFRHLSTQPQEAASPGRLRHPQPSTCVQGPQKKNNYLTRAHHAGDEHAPPVPRYG